MKNCSMDYFPNTQDLSVIEIIMNCITSEPVDAETIQRIFEKSRRKAGLS